MPKILIDTDILIDVARSVNTAIERLNLETQTASLTISIITQMELMVGCRNKTELQHLKRFLQRYEVIPVDETISNKAMQLLEEYYLSHGLLIPDGFIAATALVREIPLLSKNQRDYRFISQLNLLPYP
ncbi:type II toxin-antitoxin system VapC family toxin [Limnoraphis robusta]|uniref:Type II toxin-antitoxin system VapC family toxin n=1 Tax=Limnoraphis robusta CCNP1315 TaxID=3110306 RepID=A0ABU5U458_9CYAN|nr:type II toxin-antitoxin system VapC family toxin [Limnoraphis robusta]MEA5521966.1 type II toxin-antitoxin system VapC family toxin [Limnoraphis robusta CCNP1315]MEA5545727.1 type II toxin-antitoxin system VapC family toxin [Limnoraphis robusta CCNP1324]